MSSLGKIRKKLSNLSSGEEKLEHDIGEGNNQSFAESEDLLRKLDDLNQDFVDLLLSDDAESVVETAESIVEWEEDVAEFLGAISEDTKKIKQASESGDNQEFNQAVQDLKKDLLELKSRREEYELNEVDKAVLMLVDAEEISEEVEWYSNAVQRLDRDARALSNVASNQEIDTELDKIRDLEQNIPDMQSQVDRIQSLVNRHNQIESKASDFELDMNIASIQTHASKLDAEQAEALNEIESLLEELENTSISYKDTSSRRKFIKILLSLGTAVGGLSQLRARRIRSLGSRGITGSEEEDQDPPDAKGLVDSGEREFGGFILEYEVWEGPKEISISVAYRNQTDEILKIKTKLNSGQMDRKASNLEKFRKNDHLQFHITPEDAKIWNTTYVRHGGNEALNLEIKIIRENSPNLEKMIELNS